ncbi:MAG TPA: hypothetical protein VIV15_16040 [Anaerolineales bacterium]
MLKSLLYGLILISLLAGCQTLPPVQATSTAPVNPTFTATVTIFPTSTAHAVAYVGGSLPCFAGPQVDENIVTTIEITDMPKIQGVDESGQFLAIQRQNGGYCWIEAAYVTASYDLGEFDIVMPTRTPMPPKPSAPTNAKAEYKCYMRVKGPRHVDATLSWDRTQWAEGYRIYREGRILAELDASETQYLANMESGLFGSASGLAIYTIEAYNSSGWSTVDVPIKWYCNQ